MIKSMNSAIQHRGPDDSGVFLDDVVSLGHQRLSILDLSEKGHQPMGLSLRNDSIKLIYNDQDLNNSDIVIIFNGEIYNYLELKNELNCFEYESNSDTEIILKAYLKYGVDCVEKFNGMWAFVIYDRRKNWLFCSRDRIGVKPFYYYYYKDCFIFSSELKAFLEHDLFIKNREKSINENALELYFLLGYIPSPYSIFKNVYKLNARQNIIYDLTQKIIIKKWYYWNLPIYKPYWRKEELIRKGSELFYDAVKIRMRADVPVGSFLSGGIDSTSVTASMKAFTDLNKLHTFSIGFEGRYDESRYINIAKDSLETIHHHFYFHEKEFNELMDKYAYSYDEPFADFSGFPSLYLSKRTKENVTVALSGDGGDELFGGYPFYQDFIAFEKKRYQLIRYIPKNLRHFLVKLNLITPFKFLNNLFNQLIKLLKTSLKDKDEILFEAIVNNYKSKIIEEYLRKRIKLCLSLGNQKISEAIRIFDLLFRNLQDDFLVKVDRASMAYALEIRSPFLDYRLAEFGQKIPTKWKFNKNNTKILLKEIISGLIPEQLIYQRKQGFTPPVYDWILNDKFDRIFDETLEIIKSININLYSYITTTLSSLNSWGSKYIRIKLLIFFNWWKKWII